MNDNASILAAVPKLKLGNEGQKGANAFLVPKLQFGNITIHTFCVR